jgi:transposase-like protein
MNLQRKYPPGLEERVVNDYRQGIAGYKNLAKKYGITRDLVRGWILKNKKICSSEESLKITKSDEFKSLEDEVKYLRDANMYWQTYAEILAEDNLDAKKKAKRLEQSESAQKMEQKS